MFTSSFVVNYDNESDIGYILIVDVDYPGYLKPLYRDLPFLLEKRVINRLTKLVCTIYEKKNYVCQIELLKHVWPNLS